MELNDFVTEKLGVDLGDGYLASVYDMSPNGRWIVGYGIRGMEHFGYRIDLKDWLDAANEMSGHIEAAVYPNPVSTELHVDLLDESPAMMRLYGPIGPFGDGKADPFGQQRLERGRIERGGIPAASVLGR